jgi:protein TonB
MKYSLILPAIFLLIFSNFGMAQTVEKPREVIEATEKTVVMEEEADVEVPIAIVEVPPIYPGCTGSREESINCFMEKIKEKFTKQFVFPSTLEKKEQKIFVSFKVSKEGVVTTTVIRGQHKDIDEQVKKVFSDLPRLFPGTQRNKPVMVTFLVPFTLNKGL